MRIKAVLILILALVAASASFGAENEINKGDSIKADIIDLVEIKNLEPIKNASKNFSFGDWCHLAKEGKITAVGMDGERVLARYSTSKETSGSVCPDGAIFFYSKEKFLKAADAERRRIWELEKERELIKKLLGR